MAFPKAVQLSELPEYQEYVKAHVLYCLEKKEYPKFLSLGLDLSDNPMDQLRYYKRKERNSQICKEYFAIRKKYQFAAARAKLKERGILVDELMIAKAMNINIPTTFEALREERKRELNISGMTPEQEEKIRNEALAYMNRNKTTKEQFMTQENKSSKEDPTFGDFEPLPESEDKA